MNPQLIRQYDQTSDAPGVYLMKDKAGTVLYIGKAANLKKRLSAYFKRADQPDPKTAVLVRKIHAFDTIITASEKDALILESNLVKKYRPRYNIDLKDDKRYPILRLDIANPYPRLEIVRRMADDGALYFGPYASAGAMRETLRVINKTFRLRKCKTSRVPKRNRPCLNYQMGVCMGPCCRPVPEDDYNRMVHEVAMFLRGKTPELIERIKRDMAAASGEEAFEQAALLRDKVRALEKTLEKQLIVSADRLDRDVFVFQEKAEHLLIMGMFIRSGRLTDARSWYFKDLPVPLSETIASFLRRHYETERQLPREILVSPKPEDGDLTAEWLSEQRQGQVRILTPRRGEKYRLIRMALQNADSELDKRIRKENQQTDVLIRLQKRLDMIRMPVRIECIDNSNTGGSDPVAGLVVFENGQPLKSAYRRYKLLSFIAPDDYAGMHEVIERRYGKKENRGDVMPDLLLIDGGKGHLNTVLAAMKSVGVENEFHVAAIAKKDAAKGETEDKVFLPGRANPVNFHQDVDLLRFLERIRDEAHRFAIAFHRGQRRAALLNSALDHIDGIGPARKKDLLHYFGSIKKIREAALEELSSLPGMNPTIARRLSAALNARQSNHQESKE